MSEWDLLLDEPLTNEERAYLSRHRITPCTPNAVGLLLAFREGHETGRKTGYNEGWDEAFAEHEKYIQ